MQQDIIINRLYSVFCPLSSALYICREYSTNQPLFMQNKPNVKIGNMNISIAATKNYNNEQ